MKAKLDRLQSWRAQAIAAQGEMRADVGGRGIIVPATAQCAVDILQARQQSAIKGEFQKSPFLSLLGSSWVAYLDGAEHLERRRQVVRLLADLRSRLDWTAYREELRDLLEAKIREAGSMAVFEALADFSSEYLGRALFGSRFTPPLNHDVRQLWETMNLIADSEADEVPRSLQVSFAHQAKRLRRVLKQIVVDTRPGKCAAAATLDNLVGVLFAAQDTSASLATTALCLSEAKQRNTIDERSMEMLVREALTVCPPAPVLFREVGGRLVVISPYVLSATGAPHLPSPGEAGGIAGLLAHANQTLVFGAGAHRCPGDRLALREVLEMLRVIFEIPKVRLDPGDFPKLSARIVLRPQGLVRLMTDSEDEATSTRSTGEVCSLKGHI